jgi:glycosyltransferase involved in cell wall biosynthesis
MTLSIVIPIHNEEENILLFHEELRAALDQANYSYELIWVDDGSRDQSWIKIKSLTALFPNNRAIRFRKNFGQTAALSAGFDHAQGEIIIPIDGDRQNDPNDIPRMVELLNSGFDVVSGWRVDRKDKAFSRRLPSWIANRLIARITGVTLHDYGCTLKAYRAEFVKNIRLYGEMHRFIPIYASWEGAKITEINVNHRARVAGTSKYGINRTIKVVLDLLVIKFLENFSTKPIYVFGGFAAISILLSCISFIGMLYFKYVLGPTFIETPLPVLTVTFFMLGVLSFLMGLIAEMNTRTYFESQGRAAYRVRDQIN